MPDCTPEVCAEGFAVGRRVVQSLNLSRKVFFFALLLFGICLMAQEKKLPFGNLKPMTISVEKNGFTLNGVNLEPVKVESAKQVSLDLATPNKITVRLHFLPTLRIGGRPLSKADEAALTHYQKQFPKLSEALAYKARSGR